MANMKELAITIKEQVAAANTALSRGMAGMADYLVAKSALDNAIEQYNKAWTGIQFEELMTEPVPMVAAIKKRTVKALSLSVTKNKDTGIIEKVSVQTSKGDDKVVVKDIDLAEFEDWALEKGYPRVSVNSQWRWRVERFNHVMCVRAGLDIDGEAAASLIRSSYKLNDEAKSCEMADPTSNREAVKLLQSIVDQIVFIDSGKQSKTDGAPLNTIKVDERDLKYIKYLMCSRKSSGSVSLPKASTMRTLITDALNKNLTERSYAFDFDHVQAEPKALPGFTAEETKEIVAEKPAA